MRIGIVGGSIAGCVTAKALMQEGHDVHVFEREDANMGGAAVDSTARAECRARACVAWLLEVSDLCLPAGGRARGPILGSLPKSAGGRPAPRPTGILVLLRQAEGLLPICPTMPWRLEASGPHANTVGRAEPCSRNGSAAPC